MAKTTGAQLRGFLDKIDHLMFLAGENKIKATTFYETKHEIEAGLTELSTVFDELDRLSVEKVVPLCRNVPKAGFFMDPSEAREKILGLTTVLLGLVDKYGGGEAEPHAKSENVIPAGRPHEGRRYLRALFGQANTSILVKDNYLKPVILDILTEFLEETSTLTVRLLTKESNRLAAFSASLETFKSQYSGRVESRCLLATNPSHHRHILIDESRLFNPDHSLDQWGFAETNVHEIKEPTEFSTAKKSLEDQWLIAKPL